MKKNVLYIGGFELPDKNAAAQRVVANAKLFETLGYNVFFIGVSKEDTDKKKEIYQIDDFVFNAFNQSYPKSYLEWLKFLSNISFTKKIINKELNGKLDVIVVYNYPAIALLNLKRYCKKHNIKLIADVTEWYQPEGGILFKMIKSFDSYLRMKVLHKKLDGIIAISTHLYDYYKNINRIQLPPLVDKKSLKWETIESDKREYKKIVYVGSPGNGAKDRLDKIIMSLSRLVNKYDKFKFIIVGISKSEYLSNFGDASFPENLVDHLFFKERRPHQEAIKEIKQADYSIFLRDNNLVNTAGFPTKFVESITCNTPVLTNKSSNISDFLEEGELGYFLDASSNDKLDDSLYNALSKDDKQIKLMKHKCNEFTKFHYSYYQNVMQIFLKEIKL